MAYVLACSRLSDSGEGAKEWERWKVHADLTTVKCASNSLHTYRSENNSGRFKGGVQSLPITRSLFTSLLVFLHVNVWFTIISHNFRLPSSPQNFAQAWCSVSLRRLWYLGEQLETMVMHNFGIDNKLHERGLLPLLLIIRLLGARCNLQWITATNI